MLATYFIALAIIHCITISTECHSIQKRVTLGREAEPHSRPYQVHNIMMLKGGDVKLCGGALISNRYVLTAAHCFMDLENIWQTVVVMGAHNLKESDKEYQITKTYIIHRKFKQLPGGYTVNDIALIRLNKKVNFTRTIRPIFLPKRSQVNESLLNALVTVAGWGKTEHNDTSDILIEGSAQVAEDEEECKHPKPLICTWSTDGHGACIGDSGSSLVYGNTVVGIISSGFCIQFAYYTRVSSYLDWISRRTGIKIRN